MRVLSDVVQSAFPGYRLISLAPLKGGTTNLNYLLRFRDRNDAMVLRVYTRGPAACEKELALWRLTRDVLPVPEIIASNPDGPEDVEPYVIYRFAEGNTFQELKGNGIAEDTAGAAFAIGKVLARVHGIIPSGAVGSGLDSGEEFLRSPLLEQRIGPWEMERLRRVVSRWERRLRELDQSRSLVHGDFNNRNTIVKRGADGWTVTAILDWELASSGSQLWDVARFVCYERAKRPCREPFFSNGYCEGGGKLPEDWPQLVRFLNVVSAARSLAKPEIPSRFVPELRELIVETLDGGL